MTKKKFATQINSEVLEKLQSYSKESKRKISDVVEEALSTHLATIRIRPAFRSAALQVVD